MNFQAMRVHFILYFLASILLAACAVPGGREFVSYQDSFVLAREAGDDVMETYNEYERINRRREADSNRAFNPDYADVYVAGAQTPEVVLIRDGLAAATIYTEVLARYVDGRVLTLQSANITTIEESIGEAGTLVGRPGIGAKAGAVLRLSAQLAELGLAPGNREEFVDAVDRGLPVVRSLLELLRSQTTTYYANAAIATSNKDLSRQRLDRFRIMLANFVLLLDETLSDLDALEIAVRNRSYSQPVMSQVAASAQRIAEYAQRISVARDEIEGVF